MKNSVYNLLTIAEIVMVISLANFIEKRRLGTAQALAKQTADEDLCKKLFGVLAEILVELEAA
jgi:hypothetical protein